MAAFAEFMSGEGSSPTPIDPRKIQAEKEAAARTAKAKTELKELATNDATSAFACLVDSQVIQMLNLVLLNLQKILTKIFIRYLYTQNIEN